MLPIPTFERNKKKLTEVLKSEKFESVAICEVRGEERLNYTSLAALVQEI